MSIKEKNSILNIVRKFLWSRNYPLTLLAVAVICHVLGLDLVGYCVFVLGGIMVNLFLSDCRPLIPTLIIAGTCSSAINGFGRGQSSAFYSSPFVIGSLIALGVLFVASCIAHVIIYKSYRGLWTKLSSSLTALGVAVICFSALIGGLFSVYYNFMSFIVAGTFAGLLAGVYLYLVMTMEKRDDNIDYVLFSVMLAGVGVACQVLAFYALNYRGGELDSAWKGKLLMGAYISNTAGELIAISLPAYFLFASKRTKGWIYILCACALTGVIALTLCRAALLFAAPLMLFGFLWCCFKGKNKKFSRIFTACCVVLGIGAIIAFLCMDGAEKIGGFFSDTGFADRGRFTLWKQMLSLFTQFPVFGAGFSALYQINNHAAGSVNLYSALAHNTVFQMIGSCGIVGVLALIFHRFTTVRMIVKNFTVDRFFVGITLLMFIAIALLDQTFFFPHFVILYSVLLAVGENDYVSVGEKKQEIKEEEKVKATKQK